MDAQTVGKRIAEFRKSRGMTQQQLADMLSLTNKAISKWESGGGLPDITVLPDLAAALGVSIDNILCDCSNDSYPKEKKSNLLPIAAVHCTLMIFLFFIVFYPPYITSLMDFWSFIFVLGMALIIAFTIQTIRKTNDYTKILMIWGFPIAGVFGMALNAVWSLPDYSFIESYRLILVPAFYSGVFSVVAYLLTQLYITRNSGVLVIRRKKPNTTEG